ncbi:MAG: hypothetical protein WD078_07365 [Woeseia sp.]
MNAIRPFTPCIAFLAAALTACAVPPEPAEPITWSPEWFECDGRFECIIVYDAWCTFTSVNAGHSRTYEDWSRQEVRRLDEQMPCPPAGDMPAPVPVCRAKKCDVL